MSDGGGRETPMDDEKDKRHPPDDTLEAETPAPASNRPEIYEYKRMGAEGRAREIDRRRFLRESLAAGVGLSGLSAFMASCGSDDPKGAYESWKIGDCTQVLTLSHRSGVSAVAYSPDGTRIASAGVDSSAKIWSASAGDLLLTYSGHDTALGPLAFSPDGTRIVSGDGNGVIRIWDAGTGALIASCRHFGLSALAFSPDGHKVASAGDTTVKVWDAASSELLLTYSGHGNLVRDVAFHPGGSRIASCAGDDTVQIWDAETGVLAVTFTHGHVTSVGFSRDGSRVVSGGTASAHIWDASSGQLLLTIAELALRVAFSPGGAQVATSDRARLKLWDASTGALLRTIEVTNEYSAVNAIAFSPDGARIATGDHQGMLKTWDAVTGVLVASYYDTASPAVGEAECGTPYGGSGNCTCNTVCHCDQVCVCDQVCTCHGQGICTCNVVFTP